MDSGDQETVGKPAGKKRHELPLGIEWVEMTTAVEHALWEAEFCFNHEAFCAGLAMIRKALDLWSQCQRDKLGLKFDGANHEKDDVYRRLMKIADANPMYKESIQWLIDQLRLAGNDVMHEPTRCLGPVAREMEDEDRMDLRMEFQEMYNRVEKLITTTLPDVGRRPGTDA